MRSRYDGRVRNPWNEYECGNYYARAMASFALLGALAGFRYSAVQRTLWFAPRLDVRPFRSFFSTASGFASAVLDHGGFRIELVEGELSLEKLVLAEGGKTRSLEWKTVVQPNSAAVKKL